MRQFVIAVVGGLILQYLSGCATANKYPVSDHHDGKRFYNPDGPAPNGLWAGAKMILSLDMAPWPKTLPNSPALDIHGKRDDDTVAVTIANHASVLLQASGMNILTDPVWSERASPFAFAGPKRVTAPGIAFEDLPPIDAVLLSHCHYDHLDVATLRRLQADHAPLMAMPLGNDAIVRAAVPRGTLRGLRLVGPAAARRRVRDHADPGLSLGEPLADRRAHGLVGRASPEHTRRLDLVCRRHGLW